MDELVNNYVKLCDKVTNQNLSLATNSFGLYVVFTRRKMTIYRDKLPGYYEEMKSLDVIYSNKFQITGALNDLNYLSSQLAIVSRAREMAISALSNYEKELSNIESALNFRLTTTIAVTAIVISIISPVVGMVNC